MARSKTSDYEDTLTLAELLRLRLDPAARAVLVVHELAAEISNGGLAQYFVNASGDRASLLGCSLRELGLDDVAALIEPVLRSFPNGAPALDRAGRIEQIEALNRADWDAVGDAALEQINAGDANVAAYVRSRMSAF